jgi:anthranilate phosphoribosyltransferase
MSAYSPETFKPLLKKLVQSPGDFSPEDCALCFRHLCVAGGASDAQVS